MEDAVLQYMKKEKIPLTRKNYLNIAYFGNPPKKLSGEEEYELPVQFQLRKYRIQEF